VFSETQPEAHRSDLGRRHVDALAVISRVDEHSNDCEFEDHGLPTPGRRWSGRGFMSFKRHFTYLTA
jgi:hypothetical protein